MANRKVNCEGFTVNQLIKRLEELRDKGHGRRRVCIDIDSLKNSVGANIWPATGIGVESHQVLDDDGFITDRARIAVTIAGWGRADSHGNLVPVYRASQ